MSRTDQSQQLSPLHERWGDGLGGGFVVLPSVLLLNQKNLDLDCEEVVVLANLLAHWWEDSRAPFPRTDSLAKRTGISLRTVQRRIKQLEEKGFLIRKTMPQGEGTITHFDLHKTVEKLKPLGREAMEKREIHMQLVQTRREKVEVAKE